MKLKRILLRWYKSFHLNYRGVFDKGEAVAYRPWNKFSPSYAAGDEFPFIEIPVEPDITTIVGGNESGKSHLLNAISKVMSGTGVDGEGEFKRTDLCHYAGVRTRNVEAWPNIGLQFELESDKEAALVSTAVGGAVTVSGSSPHRTFVLLLAPNADGTKPAHLFVEPNEQPLPLTDTQLKQLRDALPSVQFIDSRALLSSELPLAALIAAYDGGSTSGTGILSRRGIEEAVAAIRGFMLPPVAQPVTADLVSGLEGIKKTLDQLTVQSPNGHNLEMRLFKEILRIDRKTLEFLYGLPMSDRGYIEGQIAKWNDEISDQLNLAHFWRQDEKFTLRVNCRRHPESALNPPV